MSGNLTKSRVDTPAWSDDCYLLLDGLAMDVPVTAYQLDDHPVIEPLYRSTRHSTVMDASPWLVKPEAHGGLLAHSETWATKGVVLYSEAGLQALAGHLRSLISVTTPTGQLAYCRFYSPEWAGRLFETMDQEEFEAWCGPVTRWLVQSQGAWAAYENPNTNAVSVAREEGWYQLRQEQLDTWRADEYARLVERAALEFGHRPEQPDYAEQRERIELLLEQARQLGFESEKTALHYLELARRFPKELEAPDWPSRFGDPTLGSEQRLYQAEKQLFRLDEGASA